jgi:hypothetical protein
MAMRIIGIDHGSKEGLVKECGAEVFLDITKFDDKTLAEEVKKVTGGKKVSSRRICDPKPQSDIFQDLVHQPLSFVLRLTRPTPRLSTF